MNNPLIINGKVISPGLAEGRAFVHQDAVTLKDAPTHIERGLVGQELGYLENATNLIKGDLCLLATRVELDLDASLAAIFKTHQQVLNDPVIKRELQVEIEDNLYSAGSAVKLVFLRWERRFMLMDSQVARQKGADMGDISNRLGNALAGIRTHPLESIPPGGVLVASRLYPSDTVFLSRCLVAAVLLEHGHAGSHAALFVRAMGIPCVADIRGILEIIPADTRVLVDADAGEVVVRPREENITSFQNKITERRRAASLARSRAKEPAVTRDGVAIAVMANVGCRGDTELAMENGADGIGLYRTEQAYLGHALPPDAEEQIKEMRRTLEPAMGKSVCVRLMDIGADKTFPFVNFLTENNPALGCRGIRLQLKHPRLLETQLLAILTLAKEFDIRILIPMVTVPGDVVAVRECLARLVAEGGYTATPELGAMIETPAAALAVRELEPHVDFISLGTNDLTQYTFAADRENAAVEPYFNDSDDIIFRLLQIVHDDAPDMRLSICGELAGRFPHIPRILRCGFRTISVVPPLIPQIKEAIRATSIK